MSFRDYVKTVALHGFQTLGVNALVRSLSRFRIPILCYHGVVPDDHSDDRFLHENTVSVKEFTGHLQWIRDHFQAITGKMLLDALQQNCPLPERSLLITFDDGYRNNLTLAAPLLLRYGVPAVFHVSTDHIDNNSLLWPTEAVARILGWQEPVIRDPADAATNLALPVDLGARREMAHCLKERCKKLPTQEKDEYMAYLRQSPLPPGLSDPQMTDFMNWEEVRRLHAMGFEIGSHTVHHHILSRCDPALLRHELVFSKQQIENYLQADCPWLAYPNGGKEDYDDSVRAATQEAGYGAAFVINDSLSSTAEDHFSLSRICVPGHLPQNNFRYLVSGTALVLARRTGARGSSY